MCVVCEVGFVVYVLGDVIEGEVCDVGKVLGGIVLEVVCYGELFLVFCVLFLGGEIIVIVCGNGWGGCNVEFFLLFVFVLCG